MRILFESNKVAKLFSSEKNLLRFFGKQRTEKIKQRMMELLAASNLELISRLPPPRCHELIGDRKGVFSVDISKNYRLLFRPKDDAILKADGGIDLKRVEEVVILGVEDTHE